MATTNEILAEIAAFTAANGRPCPAKHLTDKFGADALTVIASLKAAGTIIGKRGRTGGLVTAGEVAASTDTSTDNNVADEFAALAAKLAEESASEAAVG